MLFLFLSFFVTAKIYFLEKHFESSKFSIDCAHTPLPNRLVDEV